MRMVNIILGIGTAIIVGSLINLGIAAFHPGPVAPDYALYNKPLTPPLFAAPCAKGDTACAAQWNSYNVQQQEQQAAYNNAQQAYDAAMKNYDHDVFIIANIAGVAVFAIGFWILFSATIATQGVPIGIMMAGLWSIIYGYARGWGSTGDQLKFFVGLVIAALVIGGSIWLVNRYQKRSLSVD